jgi:hypothetical protein
MDTVKTVIDGHEMEVPARLMPAEPVKAAHTPPLIGLPFKVGQKKTFHGMRFTEILMTGKSNHVSLELIGPVARAASEYAEFIVTACNAHDDLTKALRDLYNAIDSCVELTPDVLRQARAALRKAGVN